MVDCYFKLVHIRINFPVYGTYISAAAFKNSPISKYVTKLDYYITISRYVTKLDYYKHK